MKPTIEASTNYVQKMLKRINPQQLKLGLLNRIKAAIKGVESSERGSIDYIVYLLQYSAAKEHLEVLKTIK
jgi:hypothetical protein